MMILRGERGAVTCGVVGVTDDLAAADVEGVVVSICIAEKEADDVASGALIHVSVVLLDRLHLEGKLFGARVAYIPGQQLLTTTVSVTTVSSPGM